MLHILKLKQTNKHQEIISVGKNMEKLEPCACWCECKWCSCYGKQYGHSSKIKNTVTIRSRIPLLDIYSKELKAEVQKDICAPLFMRALFTNSQKVEATLMSIDGWIDEPKVVVRAYVDVCTYINAHNGILLSLTKKEHSGTCYNMDES